MSHHLSRPLRTMTGLANQKICGDAADELDRLTALVVYMNTNARDHHYELTKRIRELEDALREQNR